MPISHPSPLSSIGQQQHKTASHIHSCQLELHARSTTASPPPTRYNGHQIFVHNERRTQSFHCASSYPTESIGRVRRTPVGGRQIRQEGGRRRGRLCEARALSLLRGGGSPPVRPSSSVVLPGPDAQRGDGATVIILLLSIHPSFHPRSTLCTCACRAYPRGRSGQDGRPMPSTLASALAAITWVAKGPPKSNKKKKKTSSTR